MMTKHFISGPVVFFDTETTGLRIWKNDRPFAFSFANERGQTEYFEFLVDPYTRRPRVERAERQVLEKIAKVLGDESVVKVGHNIKFDIRAMEQAYGIKTRGRIEDTMFMAHVCDSLQLSYALKPMCERLGISGREDQVLLQKCVNRLRHRTKKLGWNLGHLEVPQPHGPPKIKAQTEADYWLPYTVSKLCPNLLNSPEEARFCERYAVEDVWPRTALLYKFFNRMIDELDCREIYEFELKLWPIIYAMEGRGVRVDPDLINNQIKEAVKKIDSYMPQLAKLAWPGFNPDSSAHIRRLVIDKLKMKVDKYTAPTRNHVNGQPSVGREFLQEHLDHPTIFTIAKYRTGKKAFGSFFARYKGFMIDDLVSPGCKSLHANFQQLGPATGRLSCRDPNLQNVMDPTVSFSIDPMHVRNVFIPRPGYWWLAVDYSNMEVRVFADIAQEPTMLHAFRTGQDIHSAVANRIWGGAGNPLGLQQAIRALQLDGTGQGTSPEVVALWKQWGVKDPLKLSHNNRVRLADSWLKTFDYQIVAAQDSLKRRYARNIGKMVTFLKMYGGGLPGAKRLLKLPEDEIRVILREYDRAHPRIETYSRELIAEAKANGFIRSLWNRRLSIDPWRPYQAVNYMVQGSSADLMKWAMITCNDYIKQVGIDAHIILTVHDELIIEVVKCDMTIEFINEIVGIMERADGRIGIPMIAEPKIVKQDWSKKLPILNYRRTA